MPDYFATAHKLNFRPFRGLIQLGMECNITKGGLCVGGGEVRRGLGQGEGKGGGGEGPQDLNYNSWPRSSNESPANEVGACLTQTIPCTSAESLTSTSFHRRDRKLEIITRSNDFDSSVKEINLLL